MRSHLVFVRTDLLRKGVWAFHATGFLSLFMQILLKGVRKMTEVKKKDKKLLIGLAVLAALIAVFAILFFMFRPGTTQGAKSITIEVVDNHGDSTMYDVRTDAEYLRQAMEEAQGLEFSGSESEYGMMVDTVNGVTADWNVDQSYWGFFVNGEYCNYGIETQPVTDGDAFQIIYSK